MSSCGANPPPSRVSMLDGTQFREQKAASLLARRRTLKKLGNINRALKKLERMSRPASPAATENTGSAAVVLSSSPIDGPSITPPQVKEMNVVSAQMNIDASTSIVVTQPITGSRKRTASVADLSDTSGQLQHLESQRSQSHLFYARPALSQSFHFSDFN